MAKPSRLRHIPRVWNLCHPFGCCFLVSLPQVSERHLWPVWDELHAPFTLLFLLEPEIWDVFCHLKSPIPNHLNHTTTPKARSFPVIRYSRFFCFKRCFFSLRLKQGYIKKPTRRPTKTSKALRETNENMMSFEASTPPPRKMSHECRPSKRELWLKWKADQIFHQSPSIFRHKLASVVSGRLWLFCAFEAGECLANSCKNPRNPSTTVGKPTSEASMESRSWSLPLGIHQVQCSKHPADLRVGPNSEKRF